MEKGRRQVLVVIGVLIVTIAALIRNYPLLVHDVKPVSAQTPSPTPGQSWYMAGANPQRTSWIAEEVSGNLQVEWYRKFEPYIDQKTQIIAVNNILYIATANGLFALRADTGATVWEWRTQLPLGHTPTVYNGIVYIGGFDHKFYALDAATGTTRWIFSGAKAGYHTSPLVVPDSTGQPVVYIGNRDGNFYAINGVGHTNAGQEKWRFATGGQINFSAAYHNGRIYFANDENYAFALDFNTGAQMWKSPKLYSDGFHSWWPVIYKDKVLFAQTSTYRNSSARPSSNNATKDIRNPFLTQTDGAMIGTISGPRIWSNNYSVINAHRVTEFFEKYPDSTDPLNHIYWYRPVEALNISDGQFAMIDSDNDGYGEGIPFAWWAKPGQNHYPPIVDLTGNLLYDGVPFERSGDSKGKIMSWTDTDPGYLGLVGSTVNASGTPSSQGGWAAMAEPQAISGGGNRIYRSLCCDRAGDSFRIDNGNPQANSFWGYSLGDQIPGYDRAWYIAPGAISRHLGWYDGFDETRDFFPEEVKNWRIRILSNPQRAQALFDVGARGVFYPSSQTSKTVNITLNWTEATTLVHTENYTVTIPRPANCNTATPVVIPIPTDTSSDGFDISLQAETICYAPNSVNGQYGNHADQNPIIPHNGRLFVNKSNTIVAYGSGTQRGEVAAIYKTPVQSALSTTTTDVRNRLEQEVQKIINAGLLRPAYTTSMLHNFSDLANYFTNPGDTLLSLSMAYPHLSSGLQTQVRSYLQTVLNEYFGMGTDTTMYAQTGWAGLASRDNTEIPVDIQYVIPTLTKTTTPESGVSWTYPPHNLYALYMYAKNVPGADIQTLYTKAKSKLVIPANATNFERNTSEFNAWITGYIGYLKLQELAGQQNDSQGRRAQVIAERDRLLELRRTTFDKNSPHEIQGVDYLKTLDLARNFLYMNPDLADFLQTASYPNPNNTPHIALEEYEYIAPYWFVAKYEAMFGESGSQNLYQIPALFQAKAWIKDLPQQELIKYLDAPAFPKGDLFYIQNASILLEAPSDPSYTPPPTQPVTPTIPTSPTPTPTTPVPTHTPIPGDLDHSGQVGVGDLNGLLSAFGLTNNPLDPSYSRYNLLADLDGSGAIGVIDLNGLLSNFGR